MVPPLNSHALEGFNNINAMDFLNKSHQHYMFMDDHQLPMTPSQIKMNEKQFSA